MNRSTTCGRPERRRAGGRRVRRCAGAVPAGVRPDPQAFRGWSRSARQARRARTEPARRVFLRAAGDSARHRGGLVERPGVEGGAGAGPTAAGKDAGTRPRRPHRDQPYCPIRTADLRARSSRHQPPRRTYPAGSVLFLARRPAPEADGKRRASRRPRRTPRPDAGADDLLLPECRLPRSGGAALRRLSILPQDLPLATKRRRRRRRNGQQLRRAGRAPVVDRDLDVRGCAPRDDARRRKEVVEAIARRAR